MYSRHSARVNRLFTPWRIMVTTESTPGQKAALNEAACSCPMRQTLSRRIEFQAADEAQS